LQPSSTEARYAFLVEWYDPTASLIRQYQLIYYASDGTLEMVRRVPEATLTHAHLPC